MTPVFTSQQYIAGLAKTEDKLSLPDTRQGVMSALLKVLSKPFVESVRLSVSGIEVVWHRDMSDSLAVGEPDDSPDQVLSRVELEEFSTSGSFRDALFEASLTLITAGKYPQYLFVDSLSVLKNLLNIPSMVGLPKIEGTSYINVIGLRTVEVPRLPKESVIILAGETENAPLAAITQALRIV